MKILVCMLLTASFTHSVYAADKHNAGNVDAQFDQMFNNIDSDHDGRISRPEAEADPKAAAMAELFDQIDADHDSFLSKQEIKSFTAAMLKNRDDFLRRLIAADKDKNEKLSRKESQAIPKLHENFDAIDANHDGQLVYKEISDYQRAQYEAKKAAAK